jgi:hypothetical protein
LQDGVQGSDARQSSSIHRSFVEAAAQAVPM